VTVTFGGGLPSFVNGRPDFFGDGAEVGAGDVGGDGNHALHVVALVLANGGAFGDFGDVAEERGVSGLE